MKLKYSKKNIKPQCISCGKMMKISSMRYRTRGNYCVKCNALATKLAKSRIDIRNLIVLIKSIAEDNPAWASRLMVLLNKEIERFNILKDEATQYFGRRIIPYPQVTS